MAKLKITGTKAILNEVAFREKCQEHATQMKENAIRKAPKYTGKLKKEGLLKEDTDIGSKVFLNTKDVPYGLYQELGWEYYSKNPGKFFMEQAFKLECAKAGLEAKQMMKKSIQVSGSNGYDIFEYRRVKKGAEPAKRRYK